MLRRRSVLQPLAASSAILAAVALWWPACWRRWLAPLWRRKRESSVDFKPRYSAARKERRNDESGESTE